MCTTISDRPFARIDVLGACSTIWNRATEHPGIAHARDARSSARAAASGEIPNGGSVDHPIANGRSSRAIVAAGSTYGRQP